jgi:hypothetical protein
MTLNRGFLPNEKDGEIKGDADLFLRFLLPPSGSTVTEKSSRSVTVSFQFLTDAT